MHQANKKKDFLGALVKHFKGQDYDHDEDDRDAAKMPKRTRMPKEDRKKMAILVIGKKMKGE